MKTNPKNTQDFENLNVEDKLKLFSMKNHCYLDGEKITYDKYIGFNTDDEDYIFRDSIGNILGHYTGYKDINGSPIYSNHVLLSVDEHGNYYSITAMNGEEYIDIMMENGVPSFGISNNHCGHCPDLNHTNPRHKIIGVMKPMESDDNIFYYEDEYGKALTDVENNTEIDFKELIDEVVKVNKKVSKRGEMKCFVPIDSFTFHEQLLNTPLETKDLNIELGIINMMLSTKNNEDHEGIREAKAKGFTIGTRVGILGYETEPKPSNMGVIKGYRSNIGGIYCGKKYPVLVLRDDGREFEYSLDVLTIIG